MADYDTVRLKVQDNIAVITLDRPPVNALSIGMYKDIAAVFSEINSRVDEIRVAILTGAGRCFCAGRDLKVAETEPPEVRSTYAKAGLGAIYHCAVPLIAAVNGPAMGAGFAFAALCDFVIAADSAVFAMPEIDANVNPSIATLLRGFNQYQARALAFTGERVSPAELQRIGMVRSVVPAADLMAEANKLAGVLAAKSPGALRAAKWSANEVELMLNDFEKAYRAVESRVSLNLIASDDHKEAAKAFAEKRDPKFGN
jgi:enoyl-CoA hydratase